MLLDKLSFLTLVNSSWFSTSSSSTSTRLCASSDAGSHSFSWTKIPSAKQLTYHDCFDHYHCARLEVPMDWNADPDIDNRTVSIAIIKLPAKVEITDPTYGGAVITNPGGPGGSGVKLILRDGKSIQTILSAGPEEEQTDYEDSTTTSKHFDIISFDPRGVNNTSPHFTCFPDHIQMTEFQLESAAAGAFGSSDAAFGIQWAKMRALAADCSRRAMESGIGEYMTTASVARDIIEIVERHGEWREKEARRLVSSPVPPCLLHRSQQEPLATTLDAITTLGRVRYRPGQEQVLYWGFSYGTALGATLAATYPERISRAILDGVVDGFDYMRGGWLTNLQDTDMQIVKFGEYCWLGGPKHCALYHEDGPAFIVEKFAGVIEQIKTNPIGVTATGEHAADVATYSDLKQLFWDKTYNPLKHFHDLARIMYEVSQGNGTSLVQQKIEKRKILEKGLSEECRQQGPYSRACFEDGEQADVVTAGILCTDAEDQTNMTKDAYWEYAKELMGQSRLLGDVWGSIRLPCTQWRARPKWRYEGNFTATTAHPILFVSNTVDNVTPIRNAIKMSHGFKDSVVLQQDSEGHCSLASPSFCTARVLRRYFQTGELPKKGKVCRPERLPLDGFSEEEVPEIPNGETDESLWRAMVAFNRG